jgi:hypothetical protein
MHEEIKVDSMILKHKNPGNEFLGLVAEILEGIIDDHREQSLNTVTLLRKY